MTSYSDSLAEARAALLVARDRLAAEIAAYPTPVAGCDAQFNHLLAERTRIRGALEALGGAVFIATPRSPDPQAGVESR